MVKHKKMSNTTDPFSACNAAQDYTDEICVPGARNGYYCEDAGLLGVTYDVTCSYGGLDKSQKTYCPNVKYEVMKCPTGYYCPDVFTKVKCLRKHFVFSSDNFILCLAITSR